MCSLIDYAHTKMFFIKGWSLFEKVSHTVACFFFCHKFLVKLRRQDPVDGAAALYQGFQDNAKLTWLSISPLFATSCTTVSFILHEVPELCEFHTSNAVRRWIKHRP